MKLLIITNGLGTGGAEKLIADSLPLYDKEGVDAELLLLNGRQTPLLKSVEAKTPGRVHYFGTGSVYNPLHIFRIMKFFRNYDLVHVHLFPSLYWVALAKFISFSKVRLIYTEHNTNNRRRDSVFFKLADRLIYRAYAKVITIAEEVDQRLKAHLRFPNSFFRMIFNGIDTLSFAHAPAASRAEFADTGDKILIQVSSFRAQKDQKTLILALQHLPAHVRLLLVGDGPLRAQCEQLAASLQVASRVHFLGIRMDVPSLLQMADIIVLSSHHEGLSLSSLEGMACGKPFVASNVPGLREIVSGAGILFDPEDYVQLAEKIQGLLDNPQDYQHVAARCRERASQFDISKMISGYIDVYREVLNDRRP